MKSLIFILSLFFCVIASANSVTYTPDGFGGYRGSNGINYSPDGYGGFRGTNGSNCKQDYYGVISCSDGNQNGNIGWGAITNSMSGIGTSIGKSFSNSNSGSSNNARMVEFMEYVRKAQEANTFNPPVQFSGKWREVYRGADDKAFYIDEETIMRGGDSVFYWELRNNPLSGMDGEKSVATYNEADCSLMAYKLLSLNLYRQKMGKSFIKKISAKPDREWSYTDPKYISHEIVEQACTLSSNDSVDLSCEGEDGAFALTIYPSTKKFRKTEAGLEDIGGYEEKGQEIYWNKIVDGGTKFNYSLNRLSGRFSLSPQFYSLERNTWDPAPFEMLFQCKRGESLF